MPRGSPPPTTVLPLTTSRVVPGALCTGAFSSNSNCLSSSKKLRSSIVARETMSSNLVSNPSISVGREKKKENMLKFFDHTVKEISRIASIRSVTNVRILLLLTFYAKAKGGRG